MEDTKTFNTERAENAVSCDVHKDTSHSTDKNIRRKNGDESDTDLFFYDDNCLSCKHWFVYACGAPTGPCSYEKTL